MKKIESLFLYTWQDSEHFKVFTQDLQNTFIFGKAPCSSQPIFFGHIFDFGKTIFYNPEFVRSDRTKEFAKMIGEEVPLKDLETYKFVPSKIIPKYKFTGKIVGEVHGNKRVQIFNQNNIWNS